MITAGYCDPLCERSGCWPLGGWDTCNKTAHLSRVFKVPLVCSLRQDPYSRRFREKQERGERMTFTPEN